MIKIILYLAASVLLVFVSVEGVKGFQLPWEENDDVQHERSGDNGFEENFHLGQAGDDLFFDNDPSSVTTNGTLANTTWPLTSAARITTKDKTTTTEPIATPQTVTTTLHTSIFSSETTTVTANAETLSPAEVQGCVTKCGSALDGIQMSVNPTSVLTESGSNVSVQCSIYSWANVSVQLEWVFVHFAGFECELTDVQHNQSCHDFITDVETDFANGTAVSSTVTLPSCSPSQSGTYVCVANTSCCSASFYNRQISLNVRIYDRPLYARPMALLGFICGFFIIALIITTVVRRIRRRHKDAYEDQRISHVTYEPVKVLQLPPTDIDEEFDDEFDSYDEGQTNEKCEIAESVGNGVELKYEENNENL